MFEDRKFLRLGGAWTFQMLESILHMHIGMCVNLRQCIAPRYLVHVDFNLTIYTRGLFDGYIVLLLVL